MDKSDLCEYPLLEEMFFQSVLLTDLHVTFLSPTTKVLMCSQDFDFPQVTLANYVNWSSVLVEVNILNFASSKSIGIATPQSPATVPISILIE